MRATPIIVAAVAVLSVTACGSAVSTPPPKSAVAAVTAPPSTSAVTAVTATAIPAATPARLSSTPTPSATAHVATVMSTPATPLPRVAVPIAKPTHPPSPMPTAAPMACRTVPPPVDHGGARLALNGGMAITCIPGSTATITVAASGLTASTGNWVIIECGAPQTNAGDCDVSHLAMASSNASGSFTATFTVRQTVASQDPHTCSATEACMVTVSTASSATTIDATDYITFAAP